MEDIFYECVPFLVGLTTVLIAYLIYSGKFRNSPQTSDLNSEFIKMAKEQKEVPSNLEEKELGASGSDEFKQFSDAKGSAMGSDSDINEIKKLMESIVQEGPPLDEEDKELIDQLPNILETSPDDDSATLFFRLVMASLMVSDLDPNSLPDVMVQNLMQKVMSKERLYPFLKKIVEKYPDWLSENGSTLKPEELENYQLQHELMKETCDVFEEDTDSKKTERKQFKQVVTLLHKFQSLGDLPIDLVNDMAPGTLDDLSNMQMPGMNPEQCPMM